MNGEWCKIFMLVVQCFYMLKRENSLILCLKKKTRTDVVSKQVKQLKQVNF